MTAKRNFKLSKSLKVLVFTAVFAAAAWISAGFVEDYFEVSKNLDIFATLFRELNTYYVDETDPGKLIKKGIDDMLESLDPYTSYIPESEREDYRFMTTGQYGGIGALIKQKDDYVVIADPYEGFPAQKADLRAGDVLLEIDGKSAKGKKVDEVSKVLKGQPQTRVSVLVSREGEKNPISKTLTREEIKVKSVPYSGMIGKDIGYIRLTGFTENAGKEVQEALVKLKEKNSIRALVFDLRGNPGGLLNEAVNVANVFISKGQEIVNTKGKVKEWDKTYNALNTPIDTLIPLAVLVNSQSASASEIVSGTIQDLDRGVIIGQRTFGKGLVQTTRPLSYNAQLKVTTAKYYIPSGRCIQALDYSHRNEDGSVGKIPDSLISVFRTKNGKLVYDGGGVAPDVALDPQKLSNISVSLLTKLLIFNYATLYRSRHQSIRPPSEFRLGDADYNDFIAYASDKDYDYTTKSEKTLEDLKENLEKEKYFDNMKQEYETILNKVKHNKKDDLLKNKDEIRQLLEEEIAARYYFQNGRTEVMLAYDAEVKKAADVLKDSVLYNSIIDGSYAKKVNEGKADKSGKGNAGH